MNKDFKLDKTNIEDIVDLTALQEGILFHYLKDVSKNLYFVQLSLEIQGAVKFDSFEEAWNKVVDNNEMLRTAYRWEKLNKPVQVILKENNVDIRYYDLSKEENKLEYEYQKIKRKDSEESFDLREVPFRLTLCKLANDKYNLLISNHHIIYDGWSNGIILKEFLNYYNELVIGSSLKANKKAPFKNFLKINRKPSIADESFWKDYLKGFETKNVFSYKSYEYLLDNSNNESHIFSISADKFSILKQLCKSQRLTIADILYGAWGILLSKYSGEFDILFGTTISGRNIKFEGIERMVGLFINTIPIRIRISPEKPLISVLKENAKQTLERGKFENVPLRDILDYSGYNENELLESIFVVENYPLDKEKLQQQDELAFKSFTIQETTNYKLTVSALISDEIEISFNYINAYFERELIENIEKHYVRIIDRIIDDNKSVIQSLDILSEEEKQQLLYEFNNTETEYPSQKTIQKLLEEQILINPENTAVYEGEKKLSYKELGDESDCFAEFLLMNGVKKNDVIPILLERSVNVIIAIFGILKSGGIFLPIEINSPKNRIQYILEDSDNDLILTTNEIWNSLNLKREAIFIEDIFNYKETGLIDTIVTSSTDGAYVIYTSGTTGNPKGTLLEQKGLVNYITWANKKYVQGEKLDFPLFTSLAFDLTITSIFTPLISGNGIVIYNESYENEILLNRILDDNKVGVIKLTPSHLKVLKERDNTKLNLEKLKLKRLIVGGEQLNTELAYEIFDKYSGQVDIYNEYGPTEATVGCSICKFDKKSHIGISVPIGRPIANSNLLVLDNEQNLLPIGISGELCIAGVGLARGYLGLPDLTRENFIENPYKEGERLYKSGDLARWLPNGDIEFLGRIDQQVKIRGFRIELEEIENVLLKHGSIKECVVLAREENGDKYLSAYVVSENEFIQENLRNYLSGLLPDYMIPSFFVKLDSIPLTGNGKLNRKALPELEIKAGSGYIAPQTLIESKLVKIWSEVLNVASKEISTNVSFFELGGHSLKATILVSRIHKELDVRLELRDVFQSQTIQAQAGLINSSESTSYFFIPKAKIRKYYPLSSSQQRLYLLQQMDLGSTAYNMPGLLAVPEGQDKHQIEDVFRQLISRHGNFRTSFEVEDDVPVQRIHSEVAFSIKDYKIIKSELSNIKETFVQAFDLSHAPLLRVAYLEISDGDDMLLVDMHHIISDGRSHAILEEDFYQLISGKELNPLRLQYKDYSEWQNSPEQQSRIKGQESYWLDKLSGELPILKLPTDYPRPTMQSFEGANVYFDMTSEEVLIIGGLCKEQGLTLYMTLLSIFTILLSKLSGQDDIIVGSPIAARCHADLDNIVGMFVNTLVLRSKVSGETKFIDYIQVLKENMLEAYENQEYQLENIVNKVVKERDFSRNPIFDVVFSYNRLKENSNDVNVYYRGNNFEHNKGISRFDLMLYAFDYGKKVKLNFEYSTKLFKPDTINLFIKSFFNILDQIVKKKGDLLISDIYLKVNEDLVNTENKNYTDELDSFSF